MRLTLSQLKKIIKEEVARTLKESTGEDPKTQLVSLLMDAEDEAATNTTAAKEILRTRVLPILNGLIEKFVGLDSSRDEQHPILIMTRKVENALDLTHKYAVGPAIVQLVNDAKKLTISKPTSANNPKPYLALEVALGKAMPAIIAASELNENDTIEKINSLSYDAWEKKDVTALAQLLAILDAILDEVAPLRTVKIADMWYFDTQTMGSKGNLRSGLAGPFKSQEDALKFIDVELPTWFKLDNEEEPAGDFHHPRYGDW